MTEKLQADLVIEAALLTSEKPLTVNELARLFNGGLTRQRIREELAKLQDFWNNRGLTLVETAAGYRFQSTPAAMQYLIRLTDQKPPKYSRAVMETLAIIAYKQPATRGDIEEIRGVAVNPSIIRQLEDRGWIEVVGHRDTPGRPALFGTTQVFLDDLGLKSLAELPQSDAVDSLRDREFELSFKGEDTEA